MKSNTKFLFMAIAAFAVITTVGVSTKFNIKPNTSDAQVNLTYSMWWQTDGAGSITCADKSQPSGSNNQAFGSGFTDGEGQPDPDGRKLGYFMFKNCTTSDYTSTGAFFRNKYTEGVAPKMKLRDVKLISIDLRNDSYCGGGSPRLRLTMTSNVLLDGMNLCPYGRKSKVPGQPNWTRYSFTQADIIYLNQKWRGKTTTLDDTIDAFSVKHDNGITAGQALYSTRSWLDNYTINNELTAYGGVTRLSDNPKPIITPVMYVENLINDASQVTNSFAPGSIVYVSGVEMANCSQNASSTSLPTEMCGFRIKVGNQYAPLFNVSPTEARFQIPPSAPIGSAVLFGERKGANQTDYVPTQEITINITKAAPGLYSANKLGSGLVKAQHYPMDNKISYYATVDSDYPAYDNEYIIMYGTGLNKAQTVNLTVGGLAAPVAYAGPGGGVGLDQINFRVPAGLGTNVSPGLPVRLCIDGICSNTVNLPYNNTASFKSKK